MYFSRNISPETAAMWGVFSILFSAIIAFSSIKELLILPSEPQRMSIAEAKSLVAEKRQWVILNDIQWDCSQVFHFDRRKNDTTYIVFTDEGKNILGLALFGGIKDCQKVTQAEVAGVLDLATTGSDVKSIYERLAENGIDIAQHQADGTLLTLCTFCGRKNSITGVWLSVFFLISGFLLFIPLIKANKARKTANQFMKRNILRL
ncbi:MAG: hypothetical protein HY867_20290 [Chloroflexi bacterium]|nr:hypothetical protein [Chloroflexota bacterium]